jgi:hypothetical protein
MSKQIITSNPSVGIDLSHDSGEITMDDEPYGSFLPTSQLSQKWCRRCHHSIHMERHAYR